MDAVIEDERDNAGVECGGWVGRCELLARKENADKYDFAEGGDGEDPFWKIDEDDELTLLNAIGDVGVLAGIAADNSLEDWMKVKAAHHRQNYESFH